MAETVVDYEAWRKGYTPPSEHILIDQLAYRGARVVLASDWGEPGAFWVVMRGKRPSAAVRKAMRDMLEIMFDEEDGCSPATDSKATSATTTEPAIGEPTATMGETSAACTTDVYVLGGVGSPVPIGTPSKDESGTQ